MSCSYGDIAIEHFDKKASEYNSPVIRWKRFRDDIFLVSPHSPEVLNLFFNYMNNMIGLKRLNLLCKRYFRVSRS